MKIEEIKVRFIDNERPRVLVRYDKPIAAADPLYVAALHKETQCWVYRGQDGDYVHCGVEVRPPGKRFKEHRVRMEDGRHPVWPFQNTNSVAVNSLMRFADPVMDVEVDTGDSIIISGHADVAAMARYFWASYDGGDVAVCMACMEWPSGVRVFEPVQAHRDGNGEWQAEPNRPGDAFCFLVTPGDPLTPLLAGIRAMKES